MIEGKGPLVQTLLGTLFTWAMTTAGAALVLVVHGSERKLLDGSLGFAAGVMTAASYWSLLAPAIQMAEESKLYGSAGEYAFAPVGFGFLIGALFVYSVDILITYLGLNSPNVMLALHSTHGKKEKREDHFKGRSTNVSRSEDVVHSNTYEDVSSIEEIQHGQWKRMMLLVIAITAHNIPEGLAVGVGFGAIGSSSSATFESARNLAIGIGIQNFPEGLAVSVPLHAAGFSLWRSLWYGQLSGMVEPLFGVFGALAVSLARPVLPYALAFAAGAMIYVVVDDIIPEANTNGNGKVASWGAVLGFLVMMSLDVGLG